MKTRRLTFNYCIDPPHIKFNFILLGKLAIKFIGTCGHILHIHNIIGVTIQSQKLKRMKYEEAILFQFSLLRQLGRLKIISAMV